MAFNVLIVDDSSVVRMVTKKTFGMTDIPVNCFYEAENGAKALDILGKNWVDLVLLDINMPVMTGMEFMEQLQANPDLKGMPVIVVSTEGSKERKDEMRQFGVREYLRKPVSPEELVRVIAKVFGEIRHE